MALSIGEVPARPAQFPTVNCEQATFEYFDKIGPSDQSCVTLPHNFPTEDRHGALAADTAINYCSLQNPLAQGVITITS
jgi:hypothetical protein